MRFLFAIALLGVVLAVTGCTSSASKPVETKPPDTKPEVGKMTLPPTPPQK